MKYGIALAALAFLFSAAWVSKEGGMKVLPSIISSRQITTFEGRQLWEAEAECGRETDYGYGRWKWLAGFKAKWNAVVWRVAKTIQFYD